MLNIEPNLVDVDVIYIMVKALSPENVACGVRDLCGH